MSREWSEQEYDDLDSNPAAEVAEALAALVRGELSYDEFAEELGTYEECIDTASFEEAGVLTRDEGFQFRLPGGKTVYVTVQVQ